MPSSSSSKRKKSKKSSSNANTAAPTTTTPSPQPQHKKQKKRKKTSSSSSSPSNDTSSHQPPNKKRKSVSFATNVDYFQQEEQQDAEQRTVRTKHTARIALQNQQTPTSSAASPASPSTNNDDNNNLTSKNSPSPSPSPSPNKPATKSRRKENAHTGAKSRDSASPSTEQNHAEPMDFTSTITPSEQHNDDMEMTEVIRVNEHLSTSSPSTAGASRSKYPHHSASPSNMAGSDYDDNMMPHDMQLTGDFPERHPSVFDPQIDEDDDEHSHDEDLAHLFGPPAAAMKKSPQKRSLQKNSSKSPSKSLAQQPGKSATTTDAAAKSTMTKSPQKSASNTKSTKSPQKHVANPQASSPQTLRASRPSTQSATSNFNLSLTDSRLSLLHGDNTTQIQNTNITVEQFLKLLNIRLGSSANFGMKPRTSMYMPTDEEDQQRLTYEQKVHLQSVTAIHHDVIYEACQELNQMSDAAEANLERLTREINNNNPSIFKLVQQLSHGSEEYRKVRQQFTNIKSYARAKNRFEFLKWKISLEKKKQQLIEEEQRKFMQDQKRIEAETERVRLSVKALEEEGKKLRQQKQRLQRKLRKDSAASNSRGNSTNQEPSQTQLLGLMEMLTKNIHSQIVPPDRFRLAYPALNFSIDVLFRASSTAQEYSIVKLESVAQSFKPRTTSGFNCYHRFFEYVLSNIPVGKMFKDVKSPKQFRTVFSIKLHPLLNRLNRLVETVREYRKDHSIPLEFCFFPDEQAENGKRAIFRLVLFNQKEISRIVVEFTIDVRSIQMTRAGRIHEFFMSSLYSQHERSHSREQEFQARLEQIFNEESKYAQFERSLEYMHHCLYRDRN